MESAEEFLFGLGLSDVRLRVHGAVARLEAPAADFALIIDPKIRAVLIETLRDQGFDHVTLDLEGLVSGSMNRPLGKRRLEDMPADG